MTSDKNKSPSAQIPEGPVPEKNLGKFQQLVPF